MVDAGIRLRTWKLLCMLFLENGKVQNLRMIIVFSDLYVVYSLSDIY